MALPSECCIDSAIGVPRPSLVSFDWPGSFTPHPGTKSWIFPEKQESRAASAAESMQMDSLRDPLSDPLGGRKSVHKRLRH